MLDLHYFLMQLYHEGDRTYSSLHVLPQGLLKDSALGFDLYQLEEKVLLDTQALSQINDNHTLITELFW